MGSVKAYKIKKVNIDKLVAFLKKNKKIKNKKHNGNSI